MHITMAEVSTCKSASLYKGKEVGDGTIFEVNICISICALVCVHMLLNECECVCVYLYICMYICMCVCVYAHVYSCVSVRVCIHTHEHIAVWVCLCMCVGVGVGVGVRKNLCTYMHTTCETRGL